MKRPAQAPSPITGGAEYPQKVEEWGIFTARKAALGEQVEAKKRMFNLPNHNLVENK